MRSRAMLLVLLVGGVAIGAGAARGTVGPDQFGSTASAVRTGTVAHGEFSDPPAYAAVTRIREALDRDGERRLDAFAVVVALALLVVAAWWTSVRLQSHHHLTRVQIGARPRAPPTLSVLVSCS